MFSRAKELTSIIIASSLYCALLFSNPHLILERNNDLTEFFWPIINYVKSQILNNGELPLWNNLFLSGAPLLPDPQSPLFYLPNVIFLMFPLDVSFLGLFYIHILVGAIGIYILCRDILKFRSLAAFFASQIYILSPRFTGYIDAGHVGLVYSWAWFPWTLFCLFKILRKPNLLWSSLLAICLSAIFYTHTLTFFITCLSLVIIFIILSFKVKSKIKGYLYFTASLILTFGLISISLLPQLEWIPQTTRNLLVQNPDVYPKWNSASEFIKSLFIPYAFGKSFIEELDTEKLIALGALPSLLALYGFLRIKKLFYKIVIFLSAFLILLFILNNESLIFALLSSFEPYLLLRVSTRFWFIAIILTTILAAYGLNKIKNIKVVLVIIVLSFVELAFINSVRLNKSIGPDTRLAPQEVISYLEKDTSRFRVFCTTRCLSQKMSSEANLELIEGYSTLSQENYYQKMWQFTGKYWNYYTLALPPSGIYLFEKINPDAEALGEYNTKYIVSPYPIENNNLERVNQIEKFTIYKNSAFKARAYFLDNQLTSSEEAKILVFKPNYIEIDTSNKISPHLIISEVYSPGWKAYLNNKVIVPVQERTNSLRYVELEPDTNTVVLKYEPESYKLGKIITLATLFLISGVFIFKIISRKI